MKRSLVIAVLLVLGAAGVAAISLARAPTTSSGAGEGEASSTGATSKASATASSKKEAAAPSGKGQAALAEAAQAGKYLFVLFWKDNDEKTAAMRKVFEATVQKAADHAGAVEVRVADPAEKALVKKYQLDRAPMPLVLAFAPNGAVTGGFPEQFGEQELQEAFVSPCLEKCMKALQDGKLVFLCVQNRTTKSNEAALRGVRDFQADERFNQVTEIVLLDPADAAEAKFLGDLEIDPKTAEAVTAFLAPPGSPIGEFQGATNKEELAAALQTAGSACGPGGTCGPGGCGPRP